MISPCSTLNDTSLTASMERMSGNSIPFTAPARPFFFWLTLKVFEMRLVSIMLIWMILQCPALS